MCLQIITILSQPNLRWVLKLSSIIKHIIGYNLVSFINTELKVGTIVAGMCVAQKNGWPWSFSFFLLC